MQQIQLNINYPQWELYLIYSMILDLQISVLSSCNSSSSGWLLATRILFSGKSVLTKTVFGKTFLNQSSGIHLYTHSCELTSLVERKDAPIFLKVSLMFKSEALAPFAALRIAREHSVSIFVKYEQT